MKKILAILFITMVIAPLAVMADETQDLPIEGKPPIIPTIFSNKENACSIEELMMKMEEEQQ